MAHGRDSFIWRIVFESDSDDEDIESSIARREYKKFERINLDCWDETDFFKRFRLRKNTVVQILEMIHPELEFSQRRSRYISPILCIGIDANKYRGFFWRFVRIS